MRTLLHRFTRDTSGVAAVEFAIVAPVLALLLVGLVQGWFDVKQRTDAQSAMQAGVRYYLQGGVDDVTARDFALRAWPSRPTDGVVEVSRACLCGDAVVSCTSMCGANPPAVRVAVSTRYRASSLLATTDIVHEQSVRIR
ncbi:MAG: pilus assembly protein [Alphaproteobacteria bacterium]|nr:pilus assembly protein [Alphaproteobacteria bacterium]